MIETLEAVGALSVNGLALLFVCQMMLSIFEARSRLMAKAGGAIRNGTKGFTEGAKSFGENRNFYQRRQFARDARKQEQRRANVEDYATQISGSGWRSRQLRRRAAGGIIGGQLLNGNQAGQERQRLSGSGQLEKFEQEETQQASGLIEANGITAPAQLQAIAAGGTGRGIKGDLNGAGNRALQRAALQKIIDAQDAEQLENLFMNRTNVQRNETTGEITSSTAGNVDLAMLMSELQKGKNYSTTKGAGAHLVSLNPRDPSGNFVPFSQTQVQDKALDSMANLAASKLATQDVASWQSAFAAYNRGAGSIEQRRKFWDQVQLIGASNETRNLVKNNASDIFETIHGSTRP